MTAPAPNRAETSGPVSVELLLDESSELAVRSNWGALAARGMSSLAAHTGSSNRPHITLYSGASAELAEALSGAAVAVPVAIVIGAPILFGEGPRRVLARSVALSDALTELHAAVFDQLRDGSDNPRFRPGSWIPHVTIARRLQVASLDTALALLGPSIDATAVGIRLWNSQTRTVTLIAGR